MNSSFDIFADTRAEVFKPAENAGYGGENAGMTFLYVIPADIQPVSGSVSDREFSLTEERRMRMYHSGRYGITAGDYVKADGIMYRVEYAENRREGAMAIIKEVL